MSDKPDILIFVNCEQFWKVDSLMVGVVRAMINCVNEYS